MCHAAPDFTILLPTDVGAPAEARRHVRARACARHHAEVIDASCLVASELVTNAVLHGYPPICLRVHCDEDEDLEISVGDGDRQLPELLLAPADALGGRGVMVVASLSTSWGVTATDGGKVVWSRLR